MSYYQKIAQRRSNIKKSGEATLDSKGKYLLYGESGKSTLALAHSLDKIKPAYCISPVGGAHALSDHFPNAEIESVNNLDHLKSIIAGLEDEYDMVLQLRSVIVNEEVERIAKAKEIYSNFDIGDGVIVDIWDLMYHSAINQELPFSSVIVEEINIIGTWIYNEVADELDLEDVVGNDKSQRGFDWNIYEKRVLGLFGRILKLPTTVILATADKQPTEQQSSNQIQPDICSGKGNRKIQQMVGNVFYVHKDSGKFMVQLTETKDVFAKDKIIPPFSDKVLDTKIDVSRKPQYLWEYIAEKRKVEKLVENAPASKKTVVPKTTKKK